MNFSVLPSKIELSAEMGSTTTKSFTIFNESASDATYNLDVQDYSINQSNEFSYYKAGEDKYSLAQWIKLSKDTVTVAGKGSEKVEFTIDVPKGIVPHGYESVIFVSSTEDKNASEGATLNIAGRIGVTVLAAITDASDQTGLTKKGEIKDMNVQVSFPDFIQFSNGQLSPL